MVCLELVKKTRLATVTLFEPVLGTRSTVLDFANGVLTLKCVVVEFEARYEAFNIIANFFKLKRVFFADVAGCWAFCQADFAVWIHAFCINACISIQPVSLIAEQAGVSVTLAVSTVLYLAHI